MGIRESLLNTITSVGSSDFVRIVTSAGASSKATLQNVIKSFETGLGAKTSLTTSDYIRVVGSDNNLYKQSFSDVVDQTLSAYPGLTAATDVTAWAEAINGYGITTTNGNTANLPSITNKYGVAWCNNNKHGTNIWCNLFWSPTGTTDVYACQKTNATAWSNWEKMPTREEINTLNNLSMHSIQGNVSSFDSIPDGVSCGYLLNATGVPEGWYLCLKNTVASNSKELYLLGTGGKAIYTSQYRNSAWSTPSKFPTRTEVDALIDKKNYCVNLGSTGSSDKTVSSADWTTILSVSNVQLNAGTYMFICPINAKWTQSSYQFYLGLQVDSTPASSLTNYAAAQDGNATAIGYINVPTTGNHTVSLIGRVTNAQKVVTLPAYQATGVSLIRMD